jgi:hypothetical protein
MTALVSAIGMGSRPTTARTTTLTATFSTFCEGLRINGQGQGDSEHSDEGDFA